MVAIILYDGNILNELKISGIQMKIFYQEKLKQESFTKNTISALNCNTKKIVTDFFPVSMPFLTRLLHKIGLTFSPKESTDFFYNVTEGALKERRQEKKVCMSTGEGRRL